MSVVVKVDVGKLEDNILEADRICSDHGLDFVLVIKCICAHRALCDKIIALKKTNVALADARLYNLEKIRQSGFDGKLILLRPPSMDEVCSCIEHVDTSFNVSAMTLRALSEEAQSTNKYHNVNIIVNVDSRREGVDSSALKELCKEAVRLPNLNLTGFSIYFSGKETDFSYFQKEATFVSQVADLRVELGLSSSMLSIGSSHAFGSFVRTLRLPDGINQFRVGTGVLLGIASSTGMERIEGFHLDVFTVQAEVMQVIYRRNLSTIVILHIGRVDTDKDGILITEDASIINMTSDHTVMDLGERYRDKNISVGDSISFRANYYALNRLFLSPYTRFVMC